MDTDMHNKTFLEVFRKVLETIPVTSKLQEDINDLQDRLKLIRNGLDATNNNMEDIIRKQDEQENKLDVVARSAQSMEGSMLSQLQDASKQMHEEILIQRNTTRVDLNTMKQNLGKSLNEAIGKLALTRGQSIMPKIDRSTPTGSEDTLEAVVRKMADVETTLNMQVLDYLVLYTSFHNLYCCGTGRD
jgi:predicted ribosome quality control (RQC) complex YloA/Tae2 family protein